MSDPVFGISITRIDNEPRPAVWSDMAVVGIIGTATAADADVFPLNAPVFMYSDDRTKALGLGTDGTIPDAITLINAQLGEFQVAAKVVIVRIAEGADADATIANIVGDSLLKTGIHAFVEAARCSASPAPDLRAGLYEPARHGRPGSRLPTPAAATARP
ncbi:MAG: hypothetical protein R3D68_21160 [Hyphomicrobiaceae bacterium]